MKISNQVVQGSRPLNQERHHSILETVLYILGDRLMLYIVLLSQFSLVLQIVESLVELLHGRFHFSRPGDVWFVLLVVLLIWLMNCFTWYRIL